MVGVRRPRVLWASHLPAQHRPRLPRLPRPPAGRAAGLKKAPHPSGHGAMATNVRSGASARGQRRRYRARATEVFKRRVRRADCTHHRPILGGTEPCRELRRAHGALHKRSTHAATIKHRPLRHRDTVRCGAAVTRADTRGADGRAGAVNRVGVSVRVCHRFGYPFLSAAEISRPPRVIIRRTATSVATISRSVRIYLDLHLLL